MKAWLFSALLCLCVSPLACGESSSPEEETDGGGEGEGEGEGEEKTSAGEGEEGAPAGEGEEGAPAGEGEEGAPAPTCGNAIIDDGEQCDGENSGGFSCADLGFSSGQIACDPETCELDTSDCMIDFDFP